MGDAQDHQDTREDEEDLFGEEDFEDSEEAKELPNVIPKCHKKPTVSEIVAHNRSHTAYRSWCKTLRGRPSSKPSSPTQTTRSGGFKERDCGGLLLPEKCST